jgi:regulator of nucleoside diphosphate kinase
MNPTPRIILSRKDHDRLQRLLEQQGDGRNATLVERLDQELARAEVVEQVPAEVVAMNSTVLYEEEETGARREVRLCYPRDARSDAGCISVLAPIGSALLGLSVGQSIEWQVPSGRRRLRVLAVRSASEATLQPAA